MFLALDGWLLAAAVRNRDYPQDFRCVVFDGSGWFLSGEAHEISSDGLLRFASFYVSFFLSFYVDLVMSFGLRAVYTSHAVWQ